MIGVKNILAQPANAPNDGSARVLLECFVVTTSDEARITHVEADLSDLGGASSQKLVEIPERVLSETGDGAYQMEFPIPCLAECGDHQISITAMDTLGGIGRGECAVKVNYRRPDYTGALQNEINLSVFEAVSSRPIVGGNSAVVLRDGDRALEKRLELIANSRKQINLQNYILDNDRIVDALLAKSAEKVEVNIILNADTQLPTSPINTLKVRFQGLLLDLLSLGKTIERDWQEMDTDDLKVLIKKLGSEARGINLLLFDWSELRKTEEVLLKADRRRASWLQKAIGSAWIQRGEEYIPAFSGPGGLPSMPLLGYAIHEKVMIVDGARAIVGGRNLDDKYFTGWDDVDILLEGPIVSEIQKGFFRGFEEFSVYRPEIRKPTPLIIEQESKGGLPAQFVQSRPWRGEYHVMKTLLTAFQMARKRIFIWSQFIVLPEGILRDVLFDAASRGVEIRIITNSLETGQEVALGTGFFISLRYFPALLDAGIHIHLREGTRVEGAVQPYQHSKEFLIDGECAAFGSFNLSVRSCYIESENLLFIHDPEFTTTEEKEFIHFAETRCRELSRDETLNLMEKHKSRVDLARHVELLY